MPLGAARLCFLAKGAAVVVEAEVLRTKKGVTAINNAQVDTAQSKFGGSSALFDGTDDALIVNDTTLGDKIGDGDYTAECWVRFADVTGVRTIINGRKSTFGTFGWTLQLRGDVAGDPIQLLLYGTSSYDLQSTTTIVTNTWYHIAAVKNSTTLKLYINGVEEDSETVSGYIDAETNIYIGNNAALSGDLNGHIDEIRISNTARYTTGFTPSTTPFVNDENTLLLLHMDGTDASTVFEDDNGVRAKVGVVAIGDAQVDTAQSKFGGASALFDGTGDYLQCAGGVGDLIDDGDYTVECWFRMNSAETGSAYLVSNRRTTFGTFGWVLSARMDLSGDPLEMFVPGYTGQTGSDQILRAGSISADTWYHAAVVKNGTDLKLYLDGTEIDSLSLSGGTYAAAGDGNLRIGSNGAAAADTNGHIDEVRISNTARYTAAFTPSTTPFVNDENTLLLLHMDGTDASTVFEDDNGVRSKIGVSAVGNAQVDTAQSKFGGASALFDGTGDRLDTSAQIPLTGDFTIEYWIYQTSFAVNRAHFQQYTASSDGRTVCYTQQSTGNIFFTIIDTSTTETVSITSSSGLSLSTWHHLAIVRNGSTCTMYLDGTNVGSDTGNQAVENQLLQIGIAGGASTFFGNIDEVRISNTARYTTGFTPPTTPFQNDSNTLLLLHMDDTDASTVFTDDNGVPPDHEY